MRYQYVLASKSPRRQTLLKGLVAEFETIPSDADESLDKNVRPSKLVKILAKRKAEEVALRKENAGKIVIGADTVVAYKNLILGKPKDAADAFRMLKVLSGEKHHVYTGVCFAYADGSGTVKTLVKSVASAVYFEKLTDEFIWEYIKSGSPMDKAGAYGIQDGDLVKKMKGSYSNVVGLPLEYVQKIIRRIEENDGDEKSKK
ncbi:MAG: septum formation protein Maf [Clostridia bacterium]|nr:septum formation protein Maf [Clostridia bacterium]